MLELTIWMAILTGIYTAPIVHWRIRRTTCWGVRTIIAGLVFTPGLCVTALRAWYVITLFSEVTRWSLVSFLQGVSVLKYLVIADVITAAYLGGCLLLEHFPRTEGRDRDDKVIRVVDAWRPLVVIQLALVTATVYLFNYNTLGDAVANDDLPLAERRLNWNLEGLGPNDGLIVDGGTLWPQLYPLLPMAVKNGNLDMVNLLVERGAELNPVERNRDISTVSGWYVTSTLHFAVENRDIEMLDFLIDLGANPELGVGLVITKGDRELLDFFLEKGVSREFALGLARQRHFSQEKLDNLFSVYPRKTGVEPGQ